MKNVKNIKIVSIILCFFILLCVTKAYTQEEAISLFEEKVAHFEKFFSAKPKVLDKQSSKKSPTGYIYLYTWFENYKISYDIQKTDSLITPYMGYITVSYWMTSSNNCGDFESHRIYGETDKYFTTEEPVRAIKNNESCYKPSTYDGKEVIRYATKFIFAYQKKQWVYKDVVRPDFNDIPDDLFYMIFGHPLDNSRYYVEDNDFWKNLIK